MRRRDPNRFLPKVESAATACSIPTSRLSTPCSAKAALDPVMQRVQDLFFNDSYMKPALTKWQEMGFKTALAAGVVYDSYIHSGKLNMMDQHGALVRFSLPPRARRLNGSRASASWCVW